MSLRIYGNRALKTLPGQDIRPTLARVREAVFNIWQGRIEGCHWLDLCAGTGSMGAEALCRGATIAIGVEQSSRACAVIQQNWQQVAQPEQLFQVLQADVVKKLPLLSAQFDRIYFDPPYASNLYQPVLEAIVQFNLLDPQGELAVEHHPKRSTFTIPQTLEVCRQKTYGNTALTFLKIVEA